MLALAIVEIARLKDYLCKEKSRRGTGRARTAANSPG
jgi:hypothetical protein